MKMRWEETDSSRGRGVNVEFVLHGMVEST